MAGIFSKKLYKKKEEEEESGVINGIFEHVMKKSAQEQGFPSYEGDSLPLYGFSISQRVTLAVADPEIV